MIKKAKTIFSLRGLYLIFMMMTGSICFSQQRAKEIKSIDSLIDVTEKAFMNYETVPIIPNSKSIINRSARIDYERGLAYGNFYIGAILGEIGKMKEAIKYIRKSQSNQSYLEKDLVQSSRNYGQLGDIYLKMELYSLCKQNFRKAIDELKKANKKTDAIKRTEGATYISFGLLYTELKKYDSAFYFINKARILHKNINSDDAAVEKNLINVDLGEYHINTNNLDSAKFYLHKAIAEDKQEVPIRIFAYEALGDANRLEKDFEQAALNYLKAIKFIEKYRFSMETYAVYRKLSEVYVILNDDKASEFYLKKYKEHEDKVTEIKKTERDKVLNDLLKMEKENMLEETERRLKTNITLGVLFTILIAFFIYSLAKYKHRKTVEEKQQIVQQKEDENKELKQKLNEAFSEVYEMAKTNNPAFWVRFQEVYPHFKTNLSEASSEELKLSDLVFCAYIYLGFSSKEISEYTFRATKTIENYRYIVRKKLALSQDQDLLLTIRKIIDGN